VLADPAARAYQPAYCGLFFFRECRDLHRTSGISYVLISPTPEYSRPLFSSGLEAIAFYGQLADLGAQFLDLARFVLAGTALEDARRLIF
jgi:hypothetical protein